MRYRSFPFAVFPDLLPTGPLNLISDVPGILVGHHTVVEDSPRFLRTGVSVIRVEDVHRRPVAAASHVFNGYGKSMGLVQVEELGSMESHVYLTNTLSIGAVQQGAVEAAMRERPDLRSFNAMVMECNDGQLSDIGALAVEPRMAGLALEDARADFAIGSVGAGTGMIGFGFKGGIGSASRRINVGGRDFTIGALALMNFGRKSDLRLPGLNRSFDDGPESGAGSLILVTATDVPLMPHQLKRVARHMCSAIGLLGGPGHHGSGDIALAFSTGLRFGGEEAWRPTELLMNDGEGMTTLFRAAAWSCAEAIVDSMVMSAGMKGIRAKVEGIGGRIRDKG